MNTKTDPELEVMLHAFVDGELGPQDEQAVRTHLASNADAAQRADAYRHQGETLHGLYDEVLTEPLSADMCTVLSAPLATNSTRPRIFTAPIWRVAAAVLLFAVGGLSGWWGHALSSTETPVALANAAPYVARAIGAHVVYASEVRHPVEVGADQEQHLITWLSKRLGHDVHAPKLDEAGFELVGGRLLPDDAKPAAQFMYENHAGQRVTLYVSLDTKRTETAFRVVEQQGTSAIYWIEGDLGYALAGNLPREDMLIIARLVYDALIA